MIKRSFWISLVILTGVTACEKDGKLQLHMVELGAPEITSFEPQSGKPGTEIHITGNNLSDLPAIISLTVCGIPATVKYHTMHDMYVDVPASALTKTGNITVEVNYKSAFTTSSFTILTPWTERSPLPGNRSGINEAFVLNKKGYVVMVYDSLEGVRRNALWEYDPDADQWSRKADMPGGARYQCTNFTIGNKAYVGLGNGENANPGGVFYDFWEYDSDSDSWKKTAVYPGEKKLNAIGFPLGDKGYITGGDTDNYLFSLQLWEYDPAADSWTRKNDTPFPVSNDIELSDKTYIADFEGNLYNYNPVQESFTKIASNSSMSIYEWLALNGSIYFFTELPAKSVWVYNTITSQWSSFSGPVPLKYNQGNLNFSCGTIGFCVDFSDSNKMYGFTPDN